MDGQVTWTALAFLGGIVAGTVGWTWWFWSIVASREDLKALEKRLDDHINGHAR